MAMYDGGQPAGQATPEEQSWLELVRASADREWRELPESLRQVAEWVAEYASLFYPYDDAQESNRRVH